MMAVATIYFKKYVSDIGKHHGVGRLLICILLADCCIDLQASSTNKRTYSFVTEADYLNPDNDYNFLGDSELIRPNLCITKQKRTKGEEITTNYLLEIFDATLPRYRLKKRLKNYVEYLDQGEWESETGDEEPQVILLVCANVTDLIYAKRRTRGLMEKIWESDDNDRPYIMFTTVEKVKECGIRGEWEEV